MDRAESMPSEARTLVAGRYELLEQLADGATGTTYRARHVLLDTLVSVTVLPAAVSEDPAQVAIVQDAVRRACRLRHDQIVPVLDFGEEATRYHVVEEFVDGALLGRLAPGDALHVARQLADALAYAHARGVVHGALTPAAVRIQRDAPPRALLGGFATAASPAPVAYSAPERLAGVRDDPRSDVFVLGLLLFEMLEGKRFLAGTDDEVRNLLLHGNGPLLPQFSSIVPSGVSGLVGRALRRSAAHRQQTMAQMQSEIGACLQRLGERRAEAAASGSAQLAVRRHPVVVDESLQPPPEEPDVAPVARTPRRRVVVAAVSAQSGIRVRTATGPSARVRAASRRRLAVAAAVLVVVAGLAAGWLTTRREPAAPEAPDAAVTRVEEPAPPTDVVALPAPEPVAPPPPVVAIAEQVPAPEEAAQPNASAEPSTMATPAPARHAAPRIVGHWPRRRDAIPVMEGAAVDFGVRANDGDADGPLAYAWFVDGQRAGRRPSFRYAAPPAATAGTHAVEVQVSDRAGRTTPRVSWTVAVTPRMREADVRDWLDRLASAWERRDIPTLRLYGVVTGDDDVAAMRKRLPHEENHHVAVGVETIEIDGQYASVAFTLAELDARGRLVSSQSESYELEKQGSGFVGLRAR
jgi:protein kinase-like protein